MTDLLITYPGGSTSEPTEVLAATRTPEALLFAVARTPCHPLSPRWPDQPADRCTLESAGAPGEQTPIEVHEGWLREGRLTLEGPPEDGPEGEHCVVHSIDPVLALAVGDAVTLRVEEAYREALSRSHSRCHVVTLALNHALAACGAWRKQPGRHDSLDNPDFDSLAIVTSKIEEHGSLDTYRIGKSLRKAGFVVDSLNDTRALAQTVAATAAEWFAAGLSTKVTPGASTLDERRTWTCELPVGTASFPCGGTHVAELAPGEDLAVEITWDPEALQATMAVGSPPR